LPLFEPLLPLTPNTSKWWSAIPVAPSRITTAAIIPIIIPTGFFAAVFTAYPGGEA
jgi:hypothetical protein